MFYSAVTGLPVYSSSEISIRSDTAVCVTGHREKLIVPYRNDNDYLEITKTAVRLMLEHYIDSVMESGYTTLLSGLAEGTDLWAAEHIINRKRFSKDEHLVGVIPYLKHYEGFSDKSISMLKHAERYADLLVTTNNNRHITYGKNKSLETDPHLYRNRNYFLVENSAVVIAFHNKELFHSGTGQTVRYAEKLERPVLNFSIDDIYALLDKTGNDINAVYSEIRRIKPDIPKPSGISHNLL